MDTAMIFFFVSCFIILFLSLMPILIEPREGTPDTEEKKS